MTIPGLKLRKLRGLNLIFGAGTIFVALSIYLFAYGSTGQQRDKQQKAQSGFRNLG